MLSNAIFLPFSNYRFVSFGLEMTLVLNPNIIYTELLFYNLLLYLLFYKLFFINDSFSDLNVVRMFYRSRTIVWRRGEAMTPVIEIGKMLLKFVMLMAFFCAIDFCSKAII